MNLIIQNNHALYMLILKSNFKQIVFMNAYIQEILLLTKCPLASLKCPLHVHGLYTNFVDIFSNHEGSLSAK